MVLPHKVWENFFLKKLFMGGTNFFGQNIYGEVVLNLNRMNNDQIMRRWERSLINDKCIFQ